MYDISSESLFSVRNDFNDKSLKIIVIAVALLHAMLIILAIFMTPKVSVLKEKTAIKRFVVQTINTRSENIKSNGVRAETFSSEKNAETKLDSIEEKTLPQVKEEVKAADKPVEIKKTKSEAPTIEPPAIKKTEAKKVEVKQPATAKPVITKKPVKSPLKSLENPVKEQVVSSIVVNKDKVLKQKLDQEKIAENTRQKKFLSDAQEKMAKMGQNKNKITTTKSDDSVAFVMPKSITGLEIDSVSMADDSSFFTPSERSYRDELSGRLKLLLKLPEYGDVKVKLTLDRSGNVISLFIISSESGVNRKYIEKMLSSVSLPSFGDNFGTESTHTFSVTLTQGLRH